MALVIKKYNDVKKILYIKKDKRKRFPPFFRKQYYNKWAISLHNIWLKNRYFILLNLVLYYIETCSMKSYEELFDCIAQFSVTCFIFPRYLEFPGHTMNAEFFISLQHPMFKIPQSFQEKAINTYLKVNLVWDFR